MPPSLPTSCQLQNGAGIVLHFATHDPLLCVLVKKVRTSPLPELTMATGTVSVLSVLHGGDDIVAVPQLLKFVPEDAAMVWWLQVPLDDLQARTRFDGTGKVAADPASAR
jgi:hypothetical protein